MTHGPPLEIPGSSVVNPPSAEYVHYHANLLGLFRGSRSPSEIEKLAHAAVSLRKRRIEEFDRRLHVARASFDASDGATRIAPHLAGWDIERIERLRARHGGLLLALFHYGEHRHVLSDLCCLGVPIVAPIAKLSKFDAAALIANIPPGCATEPLLLEVENRGVGRSLLTALKRGRIGVIYADGNMGPDGHLVDEGAVEVDFLGHRIRVKGGIARLAIALRIPVLPLLATPDPCATDEVHRLHVMPEILPADNAHADGESRERMTRQIMQTCYAALATAVAAMPEHWEFAYCLHRWLCPQAHEATPGGANVHASIHSQLLAIDASSVIPHPREDGVYWLHIGRQRAYRLPDWGAGLYDLMRQSPHTHDEIVAHLGEHVSASANANDLLDELRALELIHAVT